MVVAKLHRSPRDQLEAAVVLEAWAGKRAPDSFAVTAAEVDGRDASNPGPISHGIEPGPRLSDFAVLFTIVASAVLWIPLLAEHLGESVAGAVSIALPLALAIDGAIRIRYLSSGNTRGLQPIIGVLNIVLAVALVAAMLAATWVLTSVALLILWGQANILGLRGWYGRYVGLAVVGTVAMWLLPFDVEVLVALAAAMLILTLVAVRTDTSRRFKPESVTATVAAAAIGGSSGLMLVVDQGVWRTGTPATAVAILLVTFTGWVASARLTRIWIELPARLAAEPIDPVSQARRYRLNAVGGAVLAASARVVIPTLGALGVYAATDVSRGATIVSAFTMFALATLALSLNVATRHWTAAGSIAVTGAAITAAVPDDIAGLPLLCGASFIVVAAGLVAFSTFRDATVAFATRMLIR